MKKGTWPTGFTVNPGGMDEPPPRKRKRRRHVHRAQPCGHAIGVRFCACGAQSVERVAWGPWKKIALRGGRKK